MPLHKIHKCRRGLRLADYDYTQAGWYFVTTCTTMWRLYFGDVRNGKMILNELGLAVARKWLELPALIGTVDVDEFVVMPNHFHGIVVIQELDSGSRAAATTLPPARRPSLSRIMNAFKTNSSRSVNLLRKTPGERVWQDGFYDHVIRNDRDLDRIREYIQNNPLKWSLDRENPQSSSYKMRKRLLPAPVAQ